MKQTVCAVFLETRCSNSDMYSGTVVEADDKILLQLKLCMYMLKNSLLFNCVVCLCQLDCSTINSKVQLFHNSKVLCASLCVFDITITSDSSIQTNVNSAEYCIHKRSSIYDVHTE